MDELNDTASNSNAGSVASTPASTKKPAAKRKSETKLKIKPVKVKEKVDVTPVKEEAKPPSAKRKRVSSLNEKKSPAAELLQNDTPRRKGEAAKALLNRPSSVVRPDTPEIDVAKVSSTLKSKNISPSNLTFGFLGLGVMGCGIVKNLINSGHKVVVWNRTATKCRKFEEAGAEIKQTPSDVIDSTDITFSCVSDPQAAKDVSLLFGFNKAKLFLSIFIYLPLDGLWKLWSSCG